MATPQEWKQEMEAWLREQGYRLVVESDLVDGKKMGMLYFDLRQGLENLDLVLDKTIIELDKHACANGWVYYHCWETGRDEQCRVLKAIMLGGPEASMPICLLYIVSLKE